MSLHLHPIISTYKFIPVLERKLREKRLCQFWGNKMSEWTVTAAPNPSGMQFASDPARNPMTWAKSGLSSPEKRDLKGTITVFKYRKCVCRDKRNKLSHFWLNSSSVSSRRPPSYLCDCPSHCCIFMTISLPVDFPWQISRALISFLCWEEAPTLELSTLHEMDPKHLPAAPNPAKSWMKSDTSPLTNHPPHFAQRMEIKTLTC